MVQLLEPPLELGDLLGEGELLGLLPPDLQRGRGRGLGSQVRTSQVGVECGASARRGRSAAGLSPERQGKC